MDEVKHAMLARQNKPVCFGFAFFPKQESGAGSGVDGTVDILFEGRKRPAQKMADAIIEVFNRIPEDIANETFFIWNKKRYAREELTKLFI